LSNWW